jgi:hypothetical protein
MANLSQQVWVAAVLANDIIVRGLSGIYELWNAGIGGRQKSLK